LPNHQRSQRLRTVQLCTCIKQNNGEIGEYGEIKTVIK
jgi:hypothetical protein